MPIKAAPDVCREHLEQKLQCRQAQIGVIGMGYVGLPLALLLSEEGQRVTGFDIDSTKVEILQGGGSYIARIRASDVKNARQRGFSASGDCARIGEMDAVLICIPCTRREKD